MNALKIDQILENLEFICNKLHSVFWTWLQHNNCWTGTWLWQNLIRACFTRNL